MKKVTVLLLTLVVALSATLCGVSAAANDYVLQVDSSIHQKYGLYYPVTYKFSIPAGSSGLVAEYRYSDTGPWTKLEEKSAADLFNGVDAARFDYAAGFAYLSVRLSRSSDYIYFRICEPSGQPVAVTFDSIPRYYDGRKGAVTVSLDDWQQSSDANFIAATDYLGTLGLPHTVMVITGSAPWPSIQGQVDKHGDLIEIGSHGSSHACSADQYLKSGYQAETAGSRDAIRNNLLYGSRPYVPVYAEPCGYSDPQLQSSLTSADYLLSRTGNYDHGFVAWDTTLGRYGRGGVVCDDYYDQDSADLLNRANALFDRALTAEGIYHLMDHPARGLWHDGSYLLQHLNYIKGRSDIWYASYGQLYQYHFLQEMRGNLSLRAVPAEPAANFSASPLSGMAPLSVAFSDRSTGYMTSWLWDFGDGSTSSLQNPVHVFAAGSYTVKLTAAGSFGTSTVTNESYITVAPAPAAANFSASPVIGIAPLSVRFSDTSAGTIDRWLWDFGDGVKSTEQNPTHVYASPGSRNVKLTVTGPLGSDTVTRQDYVLVQSPKPAASFSGQPRTGVMPLSVQFTDTSTGIITSWLWEFGDGSKDTQQNPVHLFPSAGSYSVKLTVSGPAGTNSVSKGGYVVVSGPLPEEREDFVLHIDGAQHKKFGFYYPGTYKFRIPPGSVGLAAHFRYSATAPWSDLTEKRSGEVFNGVDAVRFDYQGGFAYISVRFSPASDNLYLRATDASGQPVPLTFDSMPTYYDGRSAAVTVSLDDWETASDADFVTATSYLAASGMSHTTMVITSRAPWQSIQSQIDRFGDLIEVGSHGATHVCGATEYQKAGYKAETAGSRDAIRVNLRWGSHPYVPVYGEPCGYSDTTLQNNLTTAAYLVSRSTLFNDGFAPWNSGWNRYGRGGLVFDDYYYKDTVQLLTDANAMFEKAVAGGKIYHLMDHPWLGLWRDGSYLLQHIDYVKGRSDVWYASYGQLHQYHLLQEPKPNLTVKKVLP